MTKTALMATTALLFASSAAWAGDEPQVAEAPVPTGATSQAPLADAAQRGVLVFTPDFFAAQSPNTALDMVNRVPGFSVDDGSGARGFEGAVGYVLINNARGTIVDLARRSRHRRRFRRGGRCIAAGIGRGRVAGREQAGQAKQSKQARQHGNFHKRWRNGRLIYRKASGLSWLWALSVRCATMSALIFSAVCTHALSVLWSE